MRCCVGRGVVGDGGGWLFMLNLFGGMRLGARHGAGAWVGLGRCNFKALQHKLLHSWATVVPLQPAERVNTT